MLSIFVRTSVGDKPWGSELSYFELAESLSSYGVGIETLENCSSRGIGSKVGRPRVRCLSESGPWPIRLARNSVSTIRIARNVSPDLVLVPTHYWVESLVLARVACLILRKPLVMTLAGYYFPDEIPISSLMLRFNTRRNSLRSLLIAMARRWAFHGVSLCLVPSRVMESYCRTHLRIENTVDIGRGVSELWFQGTDQPKSFDAIFVGRLEKDKGAKSLPEIWKAVVRKKADARLIVVGSGPLNREIKDLVGSYGLQDNVSFTGYLSDQRQIRDLIRSSRLLLFPTRSEGFGRVVAEAMACGVPCVVSDIPALRELYEGFATFVPPTDLSKFATEALALITEEGTGENTNRRLVEHAKSFTWNGVAKKTIWAMRSILGDAPDQPS